MLIRKFYIKWRLLPRGVQRFLGNAIWLFVGWQFLYLMYLQPNRSVDDFLTQSTGEITQRLLHIIYNDSSFHTHYEVALVKRNDIEFFEGNSMVWKGIYPLISIADPCNGLSMYALFLGFIIAFDASLVLKLGFGTVGLLALIAVNILRCVGLAVLQIHHPDFTVFAHHYIFNVLTYTAVFGLWYWFTKIAVK